MTVSQGARRYALGILAVVYMFNFVDRQILAILLPAISDEFQVDDTMLGFLSGTAFAFFYVTLGIPVGQLADRLNRRNLIAAALAIWSGMTALSGLAANMTHLTLARIGVGIGEAGCSPPAHSMIADYYPPQKRSTAMGIYTLGISAGIMLAFLAGGWVAENIGWRQAFFIVGVPGLVLAAIVRLTVVEPVRGGSEGRVDSGNKPSLMVVLKFLMSRRSFIHMAIGAGLSSFVGYAHINFIPIFMVRSFGMGLAELGFWLGIIVGIGGGLGFFLGGYIADRLGKQVHRRAFLFLAGAMIAAVVFFVFAFLSPSAFWCLLSLPLPIAIGNCYLAPVLGQTQGLVSLRMRSVASALTLLIINLIGLGLGPLLTGMLSDSLESQFGVESMRYSLLFVTVFVLPWAALHFLRAGRTIDVDLERASAHD